MHDELITLNHGAGGEATGELINLIRSVLGSTSPLDDSWTMEMPGVTATTTDGYVITPRFFPGGDIGKLAVCGTANDLACLGAELQYLTMSLIIEEGFAVSELKRILTSIRNTIDIADAHVVTGDCKVVGNGQADGIYIVTTGLGQVKHNVRSSIQLGDVVILSGTAGDHGMAVMTRRAGLELAGPITSDCALLFPLVERAVAAGEVRFIRDATRGGVAAVVNELACWADTSICVEDENLPVTPAVRTACDMLGLDPWHVANEGKLVLVVSPATAPAVLAALRSHELGMNATVIGSVVAGPAGQVRLLTVTGTERLLLPLSGEALPRIC